jgi:hypothetical protein
MGAPIKINWSFNASIDGGPQVGAFKPSFEVSAYDYVKVTLAGTAPAARPQVAAAPVVAAPVASPAGPGAQPAKDAAKDPEKLDAPTRSTGTATATVATATAAAAPAAPPAPAVAGTAVRLQPGVGAGSVLLVAILADQYSDKITYTVDGDATIRTLDGPHVFLGAGAVGFLGGAPPQKLTFTNALAAPVSVQILVGRTA